MPRTAIQESALDDPIPELRQSVARVLFGASQDGRGHAPGGQFLSSDTRLLFIASLLSVWFLVAIALL